MRKDKNIFSEIGSFFGKSDENKAIQCILSVVRNLKVKEKQFGICKNENCKYTVMQVFQLILLFPFFSIKNAFHFSDSGLGHLFSAEKYIFYRFLSNDNIKWRNILYVLNLQLITKLAIRSDSQKSKDPVCLVADDSDHPKTGYCAELIGRIYSHVTHRSILGYKGLYLMRTDGKTQTVLDFSLHGEEGQNPDKPQGLTKKQRDKRYTKNRTEDCETGKRIKEYTTSKLDCLMNQVKEAIRRKVKFEYLLVDSWFTCKELVHFIMEKCPNRHLLGMIKMGNTKYSTKFGLKNAPDIVSAVVKADKKTSRKNEPKRIKYSRRLKCHYFDVDAELDGKKVKLFFCKMGHNGNWNGLLSTNTELSFMEAYRIYSMRWAIEVFFHEAKGMLALGKCQCQDFSSQIASISIAILQFNILSVVKRFESYETIGGLFNETLSGTLELSVTSKIWEAILDTVSEIAEMISADPRELIVALIASDKKFLKCMNIYAMDHAA